VESIRTTWFLRPFHAKIAAVALIFLGLDAWQYPGRGDYGNHTQWIEILCAVALGFIPPVANAFEYLWRAVENPGRRGKAITSFILFFCSILTLLWTSQYQHIAITPKYQDEFSYLLQMRMLAHGRLWMPALAMPEFFDSNWVLTTPKYASMYFPGTALLYFPVILLHLPYMVAPLVTSGLCVVLVYLLISELLDGGSGILAAFLLCSNSIFRMLAIMVMSNTPEVLIGLAMTLAYLYWRKNRGRKWLILLGVAAGWAAITRPADALSYAIVIGIAMLMDLWRRPPKEWLRTSGIVIAAAIPLLAVQLIANVGITGQLSRSPYDLFVSRFPATDYGFHAPVPLDHVHLPPHEMAFYADQQVKDAIALHQPGNFSKLVFLRLQSVNQYLVEEPFMWLLIPVSALALWDRRLWVVWSALPVQFAIYLGFTFFLPHYISPMWVPLGLLLVLPIRFLAETFPNQKHIIHTICALMLICISIDRFPQYDRAIQDKVLMNTDELRQIDRTLDQNVPAPAVVLFHFDAGNNPNLEPVYNSDYLSPDDAPVVRAHDLNTQTSDVGQSGDQDLPLYEYYNRIAPNRVFYFYNRTAGSLRRLGTASELISRVSGNPSTQ
jgi:hypothetical protein